MDLLIILAIIVPLGIWYMKKRETSQTNNENAHPYDQAVAQLPEERAGQVSGGEKQEDLKTEMENDKGTRDLFLETLTKIGCQYQLSEEENDNRIFFAFQGERFFVAATNEIKFIDIYDPSWAHIELYDIDEFARLKKAINMANLKSSNNVTIVYTVDEAGSNVLVHSKSTILFIPQIPNIEDYLKWALNEFFRAHHYVGNEMERLRESEKSSS